MNSEILIPKSNVISIINSNRAHASWYDDCVNLCPIVSMAVNRMMAMCGFDQDDEAARHYLVRGRVIFDKYGNIADDELLFIGGLEAGVCGGLLMASPSDMDLIDEDNVSLHKVDPAGYSMRTLGINGRYGINAPRSLLEPVIVPVSRLLTMEQRPFSASANEMATLRHEIAECLNVPMRVLMRARQGYDRVLSFSRKEIRLTP